MPNTQTDIYTDTGLPVTVGRMQWIYRWCRLVLLVFWAIFMSVCAYPFLSIKQQQHFRRTWSRKLLDRCAIHLEVEGQPQPNNGLVVGNHVSWLDIFVIFSLLDTYAVAKAEIRQWPLLGLLVQRQGTLFIQRGQAQASEDIAQQMQQVMQNGRSILLFPEGMTSDGKTTRVFHSRLLTPAITIGAQIQPFAIGYLTETYAFSSVPAYIDNQNLLSNISGILRQRSTIARVRFGKPCNTAGQSRKLLAISLREEVNSLLSNSPTD